MKNQRNTQFLFLIAFIVLFAGQTWACNLSNLTLNSVTSLGAGQYEISLHFCVGGGVTGSQRGADANTRVFAFFLSGNATFASFPNSLTSPQTGNLYIDTLRTSDSLYYYNQNNLPWACVTSTAQCGHIQQVCVDITIVTNGLPYSIEAVGAEGNGNLFAGCYGNLDMFVYPGSFNCNIEPNTTIVPATCTTLGSISLNPTDGVAPYHYVWSTGDTTQNLNNLAPGTYSVTISDGAPCSITRTYNVALQNNLSPSATVQNYNCANAPGSISLNPQGGLAPYTYAWSNGATTQSISNLQSGTYTVTITDAGYCSGTFSFSVVNVSTIQLNPSITGTDCQTGLGAITLNPSGGTAPYTYLWSNGDTTYFVSNLTTGAYTVTVSDVGGCVNTQTFNIAASGILELHATVNSFNCTTGLGEITLNPTGGIPPYYYVWDNGAQTASISDLQPGTYTAFVFENGGCLSIESYTIDSVSALAPNATISYTCLTGLGNINLAPTGGVPPYAYNWSNGATTQNISNLSTGTYTVSISHADGCVEAFAYNITAVAPLQPHATISNFGCSASNGRIALNPTGGIPPYTYTWSNGAITSTISNLATGTYTVTIHAGANCDPSFSFNVTSAPVVAANLGADKTVYYGYAPQACTSLSPTVTNGVAPYTYAWSNGATSSSINVCPTATTTYTVTVTGANGCAATDAIVVNVINVRCGLLQNSVLVCNGILTLCVPPVLVPTLLSLGGHLGACTNKSGEAEAPIVEMNTPLKLMAWPNPAVDKIQFSMLSQMEGSATLEIYNLVGARMTQQKRMELQPFEAHQVDFDLSAFTPGIYLAHLTHASGAKQTVKFSVVK